MRRLLLLAAVLAALSSGTAYAAHPLVTDDTGTQGSGGFQLEINGEFSHEDEDGAVEDAVEVAAILSYGITDTVDLVLGVPYQHIGLEEAGASSTEDGPADVSVELKWRFYEKDGLGFALKPGVTLPTGDEDKGLGAGKATYSLFFITSKEFAPLALHLNLGYIRNENNADKRENLWHASLAAVVQVAGNLKAVANIGIERNTDRLAHTHPAFVLGGLIYSIGEKLDIDAGIKGGLNKPEADYALLAGLAWRF